MESTLNSRREAWNAYWIAGNVDSCIRMFLDSEENVIHQFWQSQFSKLADKARVLDLATGNGAVPKLLHSKMTEVQIDAIDLAEVIPLWFSHDKQNTLRFHSGVRIEELPFSDQQFNLVTSQFGLEYANWPQAIYSAMRVCAKDGGLAFVMHHADSLVIKLAKIEQRHQQHLLDTGGLLDVAQALLPKLQQIQMGASPDDAAEKAREAYNGVLRKIAEAIEQSEAPDLLIEAREHVHSILSGRFGTEIAQIPALLQSYAQELHFAALRTSELLACALDTEKLNNLLDTLRACKPEATIECQILQQQKDILAWGISAY